MARMKLKKLQEYLEGVEQFEDPKLFYEQYITPPHIAACVIFNIQNDYKDLENKTVADLGCGTGMLSIGAALMGAKQTVGFEIDSDALKLFSDTLNEMEIPGIECVQMDVMSLKMSRWIRHFDTVLTNPPFGTKKNEGQDIHFLEVALILSRHAVYSLHKSSTRKFIYKKAKQWNVKAVVIANLNYNLDATYGFHKKDSVDIEVDFWRFELTDKSVII